MYFCFLPILECEGSLHIFIFFNSPIILVGIVVMLLLRAGYLYQVFGHAVKTVQVCSEMIESADFPLPNSAASLSQQKVKLNDGQRVPQVTLHHQIRGDDVTQVHNISTINLPNIQACCVIGCVLGIYCLQQQWTIIQQCSDWYTTSEPCLLCTKCYSPPTRNVVPVWWLSIYRRTDKAKCHIMRLKVMTGD